MIAVFITVENGLDVEVRLSRLALDIEIATERLSCRFLQFQHYPSADFVESVDDIMVPARRAIKGWANFQYKDEIRTTDFRRFILVAQAIGEPEQSYAFEPYDWNNAKKGNSNIVMLPVKSVR